MPRRQRHEHATEAVALRLAEVLPEPNALIGALAVAAHGYVRATAGVDLVCPADPKEIQARLGAAGIAASVRRGDPAKGDVPASVFGVIEGIRFDVLIPPIPINWDETVVLPLSRRSRLRVVDLDALIRLKLRAGGPQDLIDVVQLVRRHPEMQQKAVSVAEAYGIRDRLEAWLADPRIRSPEAPPPLPPLTEQAADKGKPRPTARRSGRRTARR